MLAHKEKEAAVPPVLGALLFIQEGIATRRTFTLCLRSKSQDEGRRLGR